MRRGRGSRISSERWRVLSSEGDARRTRKRWRWLKRTFHLIPREKAQNKMKRDTNSEEQNEVSPEGRRKVAGCLRAACIISFAQGCRTRVSDPHSFIRHPGRDPGKLSVLHRRSLQLASEDRSRAALPCLAVRSDP